MTVGDRREIRKNAIPEWHPEHAGIYETDAATGFKVFLYFFHNSSRLSGRVPSGDFKIVSALFSSFISKIISIKVNRKEGLYYDEATKFFMTLDFSV